MFLFVSEWPLKANNQLQMQKLIQNSSFLKSWTESKTLNAFYEAHLKNNLSKESQIFFKKIYKEQLNRPLPAVLLGENSVLMVKQNRNFPDRIDFVKTKAGYDIFVNSKLIKPIKDFDSLEKWYDANSGSNYSDFDYKNDRESKYSFLEIILNKAFAKSRMPDGGGNPPAGRSRQGGNAETFVRTYKYKIAASEECSRYESIPERLTCLFKMDPGFERAYYVQDEKRNCSYQQALTLTNCLAEIIKSPKLQ